MRPTVVAPAEHLPFADSSFDVVACRIAAHHFSDVRAAVRELARVTRDRVVVQDNVFLGDDVEEAEKLRDPTHVRCYSEDEWRGFFADAGLEVVDERTFERRVEVEPWLTRVETPADDAARVRELLAERIDDGRITLRSIVLKGHH
jgi:ubiquinone/menaquinone biosynthesis C-methylase UbiE